MFRRLLMGALILLAAGFGGYIAGRSATPALAIPNERITIPDPTQLKIAGLETRIDTLEKQVASLNKHGHAYNPGFPATGFVNVPTFKGMLDNPGAFGTTVIPIATNFHQRSSAPITGPPVPAP